MKLKIGRICDSCLQLQQHVCENLGKVMGTEMS